MAVHQVLMRLMVTPALGWCRPGRAISSGCPVLFVTGRTEQTASLQSKQQLASKQAWLSGYLWCGDGSSSLAYMSCAWLAAARSLPAAMRHYTSWHDDTSASISSLTNALEQLVSLCGWLLLIITRDLGLLIIITALRALSRQQVMGTSIRSDENIHVTQCNTPPITTQTLAGQSE